MADGSRPLPPASPPTSGTTWRTYLRWFAYTTIDESAESERVLLETHGNLPLSSDPKHVQSKLVPLDDHIEETPREADRFINTLVVDEQDVEEGAAGRRNVVLCHGFGAGLGFFYRNLRPLSQAIPHGRVYAIDLLGMGRSGRPDFPKFDLNATFETRRVRGPRCTD